MLDASASKQAISKQPSKNASKQARLSRRVQSPTKPTRTLTRRLRTCALPQSSRAAPTPLRRLRRRLKATCAVCWSCRENGGASTLRIKKHGMTIGAGTRVTRTAGATTVQSSSCLRTSGTSSPKTNAPGSSSSIESLRSNGILTGTRASRRARSVRCESAPRRRRCSSSSSHAVRAAQSGGGVRRERITCLERAYCSTCSSSIILYSSK